MRSIALKSTMEEPLNILRRFADAQQTQWTLNKTMAALEPFANDVLPDLLEALESNDRNLQLLSLQVIRELGADADKAVPVLMEFLRHDSRLLRCGAITALGAIGPAAKNAVPVMAAGLDLEDDFVRALSVRSVLLIAPEIRSQLMPVIEELLRSDDECVRLEVQIAV